ncbi:MAG: hypothetical protein Q4B54_04255 [Coriobacteriales bacterium]|nr:hypothetical protein [Coriobacteriales bacterium]
MAADNNQGMDLMQLAQQVMGNQDLLNTLSSMNPADTAGIADAIKGAGIPVSTSQITELMGMASGLLGSVDLGQLAKGVDLSNGLGMDDVQGLLGGLMGGK